MNARLRNLSNKRILVDLLGTTLERAYQIAKDQSKFYCLKNVGKKGKKRPAEVPCFELQQVHSKAKILFDEFPSPEYRHCGRKKRSYRTNAETHRAGRSFASGDIKSYYKNSTREHLFRYLHYARGVAQDVAWLFVDLITYKGFLPTGSASSQAAAFWSHKETFDRIDEDAKRNGHTFGLYVDDMGFSSQKEKINPLWHQQVTARLKKSGLKLKPSKVRTSRRGDRFFPMTGAILDTSGKLHAPRRLIENLFKLLDSAGRDVEKLSEEEFRSALGTLRSIRSIEQNRFPTLYGRFLAREKELNRRDRQRRLHRERMKQKTRQRV